MSVKIRLSRIGTKGKPFYRVVAVDESKKRNGRVIEILGTYNPLPKVSEVVLKNERIVYWLSQGARPSDTVRNLLKKQKIKV